MQNGNLLLSAIVICNVHGLFGLRRPETECLRNLSVSKPAELVSKVQAFADDLMNQGYEPNDIIQAENNFYSRSLIDTVEAVFRFNLATVSTWDKFMRDYKKINLELNLRLRPYLLPNINTRYTQAVALYTKEQLRITMRDMLRLARECSKPHSVDPQPKVPLEPGVEPQPGVPLEPGVEPEPELPREPEVVEPSSQPPDYSQQSSDPWQLITDNPQGPTDLPEPSTGPTDLPEPSPDGNEYSNTTQMSGAEPEPEGYTDPME